MAALHRQLLLRLTIPVAALVSLLLGAMLTTILWVASYQTEVAREMQVKLAGGAISVRGQQLGKSVLDYGTWNSVVDHVIDADDKAWADENIGEVTFQNFGFDVSAVYDASGRTRYAAIGGKRTDRAIDTVLTGGFRELVARQRAGSPTASTTGLVLADGMPAIAAVSAIRRFETAVVEGGPQDLLVFVDLIDPTLLEELSQIYLLPHLRLVPTGEGIEASTPLQTADGRIAAHLTWDEARPGDTLLRTALPVWGILALCFGALTNIVLRQTKRAARMIADGERRATHDTLTGLPNRVLFFDHLDRALRIAMAGGARFAVLYLDLDGFKAINEGHGHDAGDAVLCAVAARIKSEIAGHDLVARLGGDEFALILTLGGRSGEIVDIGENIILAISAPVVLPTGEAVRVAATIGATLAPEDAADPLLLLRYADQALLLGKRNGKGHVRLHANWPLQRASQAGAAGIPNPGRRRPGAA